MFDLRLDSRPILRFDQTVEDALAAINVSGRHLAVVVDAAGRLAGIISDGSIRRALLAGTRLHDTVTVTGLISTDPVLIPEGLDPAQAESLLLENGIDFAPVIDADGRPIGLLHIRDLHSRPLQAAAVIMAGGEGRRLLPLTKDTPKPLIDVGGKPLIEHIVRQLSHAGIDNLHVSVNYLADKIKSHLGDGAEWGTQISYLEEIDKLGTAGALSLLPADVDHPLLVMNGDIMTNSDFRHLLDFHRYHKAALTVCVVEYSFAIPYGVFSIDDGHVTGLMEKPEHKVPINAGIYVVEPRLLKLIPPGRRYDMTNLIEDCLKAGEPVVPYLIHEHWMDIGNPRDLETARSLAAHVLKNP